jgi:tetratricopeptide (TPR) repeat protein
MNQKLIIIIAIVLVLGAGVFLGNQYRQKDSQLNQEENLLNLTIVEDLENWYKKESEEKFSILKESILADPTDSNLWLALGTIKKNVGDFAGARDVWLKSIELAPQDSRGYYALANLYSHFLVDHNKAVQYYQLALDVSGSGTFNITFYKNYYSFTFDVLKDKEKAEAILLQGIAVNPASPLLYVLGNFYAAQGDKQKAAEYYNQYLEVDPQDETVKQYLDDLGL